MEEHLQQLPQSGRKKRAPGTRIGAAAGAAVLIAIFFGISSQKEVKAANLFLPLKGEGRPGTIAKFANSADLVHIQQRAFKLARLLYYCLSMSRRIFMPIRILRRLPAAAFAALLVILAFIAPTPIAAAGSAWVDNGATACEKYLTPDVVATILRNPAANRSGSTPIRATSAPSTSHSRSRTSMCFGRKSRELSARTRSAASAMTPTGTERARSRPSRAMVAAAISALSTPACRRSTTQS